MPDTDKMVKQKVKIPRLATFFLCSFLILFLMVSPQGLLPLLQIDFIDNEIEQRRSGSFHGVITLWQIDAFEGGIGSRTAWLNGQIATFERQYNGVFIIARSVSLERAALLLSSKDADVLPDMISFGAGVKGIDPNLFIKPDSALLLPLRPDVADTGGGYCVPWCMGGYTVLADTTELKKATAAQQPLYQALGAMGGIKQTKKGEKTIYSLGIPTRMGYMPEATLAAAYEDNASGMLKKELALRNNPSDTALTLFEAYNFAYTVNAMLGTQRDIYRIINAENAGKSRETTVLPMGGYTDLVQYIGILTAEDKNKVQIMENFIGTLLQLPAQESLSEIGLFPTAAAALPTYGDERMQNLFLTLHKEKLFIPQVFATEKEKKENLESIRAFLTTGAEGEKVKNYFDKS